MGINGLWQTISKKYPDTLKSVYRRSFRGRRIAVDANYWFFVLRAAIRSRVIYATDVINHGVDEDQVDRLWIDDIFKRLMDWMTYGITPILVYDGPSPVKKAGTKVKRTKDKDRVLKQIEDLNEIINPLSGQIDFAKLQELGITDLAEYDSRNLEQMRKLLSQLSYIPANSMKKVKEFFRGIGFPTLTADGDGERLAAAICASGIAAAAYSADGDTLVHGCPILIKGPGVEVRDKQGIPTDTFEIVILQDVLEALEVNFRQFVDICITAGCDYNVNMPKKAMGAAIKLVKQFDSIDNFPRDKHDITCLDHVDCRKLFEKVPMKDLILESSVPEIFTLHPDELSMMLGMKLNFSPESSEPVKVGSLFDMAPINVDMLDTYKLTLTGHFANYDMVGHLDRYLGILSRLAPPVDFTHTQHLSDDLCIAGDELANVSILTVKKTSTRKPRAAVQASAPILPTPLLHYNPLSTMAAVMPIVYTACSSDDIEIHF